MSTLYKTIFVKCDFKGGLTYIERKLDFSAIKCDRCDEKLYPDEGISVGFECKT